MVLCCAVGAWQVHQQLIFCAVDSTARVASPLYAAPADGCAEEVYDHAV